MNFIKNMARFLQGKQFEATMKGTVSIGKQV